MVPTARELGDLELLLTGAYRPLTGFLGRPDADTVISTGRLADGTPWPAAITVSVPDETAAGDSLVLADPEGAPVAVLDVEQAWSGADGRRRAGGPVRALRPAEH